jgi:Tol biopolymer transport system component
MRKAAIFVGVLLLVGFTYSTLALQNGYDLFQKALAKERAEGNLEEAIALYQKVIAESKDESLSAKAQLRIGICYEKLGQEKSKLAQEAFRKVVDNYPKQVEEVKVAREKLSGLVRARAVVERGDTGLKIRQLASGTDNLYDGWLGAVSPDGRYVSIVDWKTNNLAIRDLTTGKKQFLTDQKSEIGYPLYSTWSPDGKKIVYDWWHGKSFSDIRTIGIEDKKPHTVYKNEEIAYAWPLDWFPDGEHILIALSKDGLESQMAVLSLNDKTARAIPINPGRNAHISPDGRYIAYSIRQGENDPEMDIYLYSIGEKREVPLIEHPANDEILDWSPDGGWILFRSSRLGSNDAWIIAYSNGKTQGNPLLVKKGMTGSPMGFNKNGSFYFMSSKQMEDIYIASLDPETGKIQIPPKKLDLPSEGSNDFPAYSPDGKNLAYIGGSVGYYGSALHIRFLNSEKEKTIPLNIAALHPRWSPDGQAILISGITESRLAGIFRIDVQTGDIKAVLFPNPSKKEEYRFSEWTPDGKSFFYIQGEKGKSNDLICRYDFETKKKKKIHQTSHSYANLSLSPDGKWLAFIGRELKRELKIIPAEGGVPHVLCRFNQKGGAPIALSWSPDSQYILFFKKSDVLGQKAFCRMPLNGGELLEVGLSMLDPDEPQIHPNGREIVFSSEGFSLPYPEYWVMENFLPETEKK